MKILCIYSILVVAFAEIKGDNVSPKNPVEKNLVTLLSKWRSGGVFTDLFSLPSLKSISIAQIKTTYRDNAINLELTIGDMELTGIDSFVLNTLNITQTPDLLDISVSIVTPKLELFAENYELDGRAYLIYPLRGNGAMTVETRNNLISLNARVANIDNASTLIGHISLDYTIGELKANLEKSSWPINDVLSNEGGKILESYKNDLTQAINDYVIPNANNYLSDVSLTEFLDLFSDISINSTVNEES